MGAWHASLLVLVKAIILLLRPTGLLTYSNTYNVIIIVKAIVVNSSSFVSSRDRLMPWSGGSGTGSWVTGHAGRESADCWVTWVTGYKMWPIVSSGSGEVKTLQPAMLWCPHNTSYENRSIFDCRIIWEMKRWRFSVDHRVVILTVLVHCRIKK